MSVKINIKERTLLAFIDGEIDHHTAKSIRSEIDAAIDANQPNQTILDFSAVTFMDSSGIGLVMGRYKIMQGIGGTVVIQNPPNHIKRVMQIAGLEKIAAITTVKVS